MADTVEVFSLLTDFDISLFKAGKHFRLYEKFGSQTVFLNGQQGVYFAVWAPNAKSVSVIGDFNGWNTASHQLYVRWDESGIWEGVIFGIGIGTLYKYFIETSTGQGIEKSDPFALVCEIAPRTASLVGTTWYQWNDERWMRNRNEVNRLDRPISVYEMHLGSWIRDPQAPDRLLSYREVADKLVPYIKTMGFTHVELMPIMEHPYYPSWGYQVSGYFAATSRYGSPQDLMFLIESLHKNDIAVILDWVPSHFPGDDHGLRNFDGSALYEHEDPRKGFHPDWKSYIFNYGRNEVRSFLISNALFWLDRYHVDGIRVDAVASMLYLDYSRNEGEWEPNEFGGRENLESIHFLKEFNDAVQANFPEVLTIAEESTSWSGVTRSTAYDGLGFSMKWMMGWMHDSLNYFKEDAINRKYHHDKLTFSSVYAFSERFMLPLSHDEVVHGKLSLLNKMHGDEWQKFANLRALYLYMFTFSGAKLLFMGAEIGQWKEWNVDQSLDWNLLEYPAHRGLNKYVKELNRIYKNEPALYELAFSPEGFEWIEMGDAENSVLVYVRRGHDQNNDLIVVLNLTPVVRKDYRIGVPVSGIWEVIFNSDDLAYFGSGVETKNVKADSKFWMGKNDSISIDLPPLSGLILKCT